VALHDEAYPAGAIVQQAMGLTIRSDKCKSTMAGEEVTFLNHPASPTPASLAPKGVASAETALRKIENAPITIHQKLILLSLRGPDGELRPPGRDHLGQGGLRGADRRRTRLQH
ncbi:Reverse transcriptase/endonuclease, partial [Giardia duodenalis]